MSFHRLYCDFKESQSRKSCIYVLNEIYQTLTKVLAPVLPYLCEEVHYHYANGEWFSEQSLCNRMYVVAQVYVLYAGEESVFQSPWFESESAWDNPSVSSVMELALDLRTTINQMVGERNSKTVWAEILCNEKAYQDLQVSPCRTLLELISKTR